jgi:hypothetical protein
MKYTQSILHECICPDCDMRHMVELRNGVYVFIQHYRKVYGEPGLTRCKGSNMPVRNGVKSYYTTTVRARHG